MKIMIVLNVIEGHWKVEDAYEGKVAINSYCVNLFFISWYVCLFFFFTAMLIMLSFWRKYCLNAPPLHWRLICLDCKRRICFSFFFFVNYYMFHSICILTLYFAYICIKLSFRSKKWKWGGDLLVQVNIKYIAWVHFEIWDHVLKMFGSIWRHTLYHYYVIQQLFFSQTIKKCYTT